MDNLPFTKLVKIKQTCFETGKLPKSINLFGANTKAKQSGVQRNRFVGNNMEIDDNNHQQQQIMKQNHIPTR